MRLEVDLYPAQRRYAVRGSYSLENRTESAIESLWVVARRDLSRIDLRVAGRLAVEQDAVFGTQRFALSPPLSPGGRVALDFDLEVVRRGAVAGDPDHGIVRNGSFLLSHTSLPTIGYRRSYELEDSDARRRQGLAPRARSATLEEAAGADLGVAPPVLFTFDATLTTEPDQIALAPGALVESGERNGRRFFRYRSPGAVSPLLAFVSGRYAVVRREHHGVALEVYHHPDHAQNVEAMLDAAARALDYCVAQFGPYPHAELRIVEAPSSSPIAQRGTGFALPGTIFLLEHRGFLTDRSDAERVDIVTKRVAHEVAHQWWGHQVSPAALPGASTLVESLARYTEMRVLAELHGEASVARLLAFELDRYLAGRAGGDEVPLTEVEDQGYVSYAKGGLVMAAIRDLIGEPATNAALRRLIDDVHAGRQPDANDLLTYLLEAAPEEDHALIEQWLRGVVLYDLRVAAASGTALAGGRQRIDLRVEARKSDGGAEHELPMNEEIEIALYADDPGVDGRGGEPLQTRRYRLRGATDLSFEADGRARYVLVDPDLLRIDRNRADNLRPIARVTDR